jgi:hypothetical protein
MDQARAWKHDTDLGNRLTDHAFGLLCGDAVLAITGRQNAGRLPDRGARRVREDPAAAVNLAGENRPMALTISNHLAAVRMLRTVPGSATAERS